MHLLLLNLKVTLNMCLQSKRRKLFSFIDKRHITNDDHCKLSGYNSFKGLEVQSTYQELDDYLAAVHSEEEIKKGSLVYWKNNSIAYPILSCLAKKSTFCSCHISTCREGISHSRKYSKTATMSIIAKKL